MCIRDSTYLTGESYVRVLYVRCHIPGVAERVCDGANAVTVELVLWFLHWRCSSGDSALVPRIDIVNIQVQHRRHRLVRSMSFAHLQHRVADPYLGVQHWPFRRFAIAN